MDVISKGAVTIETKIDVEGEFRYLSVIFAAIYDAENRFEGNFAIVRDITSEKNYIENITYLANKDYLTGINNRRSFFEEGEQLFNKQKTSAEPLTVVMLDIDHFKRVNDTYGHDAGDIVIKGVADFISENVCEECVLGRYGGEEYAVLIPKSVGETYKGFEEIRKMLAVKPFVYEKDTIHINISVGISPVDYETDSLEKAITKSDKALYESKENGRNQCTIFVDAIHGEAAFDSRTSLFNKESMGLKLSKSLFDARTKGEQLHLIYFEMDVIKTSKLFNKTRHLSTVALSIKRAVRERDIIGHVGENGFLILLKHLNTRQVDEIYMRIVTNLELGFHGMHGNVITFKGTSYNASFGGEYRKILSTLKHQTKLIQF
jgi:diguanylate cyclase (GGDEF)-like protein